MNRILLSVALLLGLVHCAAAKVLVIGLDGADWRVIDPLVQAGHLPTIGDILARSARANLDCEPAWPVFSCYCPPVWNTVSTGQPQRVHGIYQGNDPSWARRVPAVWNLAAAFGKSSMLINYRNTYPVEPGVAYMVGEPAGAWAAAQSFALFPPATGVVDDPTPFLFPPSLFLELGVLTPPGPEPWWQPFAVDEIGFRVLRELSRRGRYADLTFLLVHGTDKAEHINWGTIQDDVGVPLRTLALLEQANQWVAPTSGFGSVASQYLTVDRFLGSLDLTQWEHIVFVSDHGMTFNPDGPLSGHHGPSHPTGHTGIFSVGGAGVRVRRSQMYQTTVLDVAPTLAYMLGLPIASDLPGRAQRRFFNIEFRRQHRQPRVESWAQVIAAQTPGMAAGE